MKENKNKAEKLNKKEEEKVTGGYIHYDQNSKAPFKYVLLKDSGKKIIGKYETLDEALYFAALNGVSPKVLTDDEYFELKHNVSKNEYKNNPGIVFVADI